MNFSKVNTPTSKVKTPTSTKSRNEEKTPPPEKVSKPKTPAKKKLDFTADDHDSDENESLMASPRKISRTPRKKPPPSKPIEEILVVKSIEAPPPPPSRSSNTAAKRIVNSPRPKKSHLAE